MQKKLIALAVAGLVSGGAFAQSNVTIYGIVDLGVDYSNSGYGSKFRATSGSSAGSRLGFKGEEALGGGNTAFFVLETGFTPNNGQTSSNGSLTQPSSAAPLASGAAPAANATGANTGNSSGGSYAFQRQGILGVKGGWGQFSMGRQYTPQFLVKCAIDVSGCGHANSQGAVFGIPGYADRFDNSLMYMTPTFSGFTGAIGYSSGANNNNNGDLAATVGSAANVDNGKTWGLLAQYANGPAYLGFAYHRAKAFAAAGAANAAGALYSGSPAFAAGAADQNVGNVKGWVLGGTWDFQVAKASVAYGTGKQESGGNAASTINTQLNASDGNTLVDSRFWSLGVKVPLGAHMVNATYGKFDSKLSTNKDWSIWGFAYEYAMSKRTSLYASYAKVNNKDNPTAAGGAGAVAPGGALNNQLVVNNVNNGANGVNFDPNTIQAGIRHSF